MYRVIKVLNNNGILVYHVETGKEMILLGNGVGFGKKPTEQIEKLPGAKVYSLVTRRKQESVLKTVNGIRPEFIEDEYGKIIEEAENVFQKINHEMLLPLADHIALAAKRAKENSPASESIYTGYPCVVWRGVSSGPERAGNYTAADRI